MDKILNTIWLMLEGTQVTLEIFTITLAVAIPLGLLAALARISGLRPLAVLMEFYIWLMRGTPLMLQLLFVYFALPMVGIMLPDIAAALLAFILNYAAYFAEIYRSGIESMPAGQYEAAKVLGYTKAQTFMRIILPQVIKRILPPVTNETITLVKDTSLAFVLAQAEMFTMAKQIAAKETSIMPLMAAGLFYYIFNLIVAFAMERLEKALNYYK